MALGAFGAVGVIPKKPQNTNRFARSSGVVKVFTSSKLIHIKYTNTFF